MQKYLILICVIYNGLVFADVPASQASEVKHLLDFVRNSKCIISRNGTEYSGEKGVKHIENKYDYFRDDIKNTEDFVTYSATKSTMSGKFYTVTCAGKKTNRTQYWLLAELERFRKVTKSSDEKNADTGVSVCKVPRPEICTMQYVPVCATLIDGAVKTYPSDCSACSDVNVHGYKSGSCEPEA